MKKNSIKNTRINQEVQKELSVLIDHCQKAVVAAEVAPDLKTARIYISVLGDDQAKKNTLQGLKSAAPFLRGQLARTVNLRNTPQLLFVLDESIEHGVAMSRLIDEVASGIPDRSEEDDVKDDSSGE